MAFKANAVDPQTGFLYKKSEVYIKVVSDGSGKTPKIEYQADGKTPVIDEATGQPKVRYTWDLNFRFIVFSARTHKPLFQGSGVIQDYDTETSAETQIYNRVKQLKWQYWHPAEPLFDQETYGEVGSLFEAKREEIGGKVFYPLFTDAEDC